MTVTDTPPGAATEATEVRPQAASSAAPGGLAGIIGTGDHLVLGRLYIGFALLYAVVAGVAGQVSAIDKVDGELGNQIVDQDTVFQVLTFHSTAGVFLFLLPLLLGIAFCVVPLQIGSPTLAFPRAAAASFWTWLVAADLYIASFVINGGPGGGSQEGVGLWAASFIAVLAALLVGAACVVTTVLTLRAPGMTVGRAPLFSWSLLVSGGLWILSLPVLIATLILVYVDHRYGQQSFGVNGEIMYARIAWALRQPQIYAFAVPALGFIGDVVPVAAGLRQPRRWLMMGAIAGFAVLGFGAFVQSTVYVEATRQPVYDAMAVLALLPVLALAGGWAAAVKAGKPRLISPLVFAVAALLMLLAATLVGAVGWIDPLDVEDNALFGGAQVHYTVLAAVIAGFGGLWYWATRIFSRPLPEGIGRTGAVVLLLGTVALALPNVVSAVLGDGAEATAGIEALNAVSAAGGGLVLLGVLVCVLGLLAGLRGGRSGRRDRIVADPWDGHTLEWDDGADPADVTSAEPLLDRREAATATAPAEAGA